MLTTNDWKYPKEGITIEDTMKYFPTLTEEQAAKVMKHFSKLAIICVDALWQEQMEENKNLSPEVHEIKKHTLYSILDVLESQKNQWSNL